MASRRTPSATTIATDAVLPQRLPEPGQGAAQVRPGTPLDALRPQELGKLSPRALPPLGGQVTQKRERLFSLEPGPPSLEAHLKGTQQPDTQQLFFRDLRLLSRATLSQRPAGTVASVGPA